MFLCGTSKPAHMQIAIYIQYRRGEHANWAHRKHQTPRHILTGCRNAAVGFALFYTNAKCVTLTSTLYIA